MDKTSSLNKGDLIKADLYSRPNAMNGKYKAGQLDLDDFAGTKSGDIFFLETLKMKADLADRMIAEADSRGEDTTDPKIMKLLGEKINALGTPVNKREPVLAAFGTSLRLIVYYGVAVGIWGVVFKKDFIEFILFGAIAGLLISLLFIAPVIAYQRTEEQIGDMSFGAFGVWGTTGIIIGLIGLLAWVIKLIFF